MPCIALCHGLLRTHKHVRILQTLHGGENNRRIGSLCLLQNACPFSLHGTCVLQEAGNEAFAAGAFSKAVAHYSRALREQPQDAVLLSKRAACFLAMKWQAPLKFHVFMT